MDKIWYLYIDGKKEGPYDILDLKRHPKVTPDTLAWKPGFSQWVPMRSIFELMEVFKDEEVNGEETEEGSDKLIKKLEPKTGIEDDAVVLRYEPPYSYFWIVVAVLIILYTFYLLSQGRP